MPFIDVNASCPISEEQEAKLKTGLGRAISLIPGKNESHLMLHFAGGCHMWYAGSQEGPTVMIEAAIYGHTTGDAVNAFGQEAVELCREVLGAKNVYFKMEQTEDWAF